MIAVPAPSDVTTPRPSTLARSGVSDDHVKVVGMVVPSLVSEAKSWIWNPIGTGGSPPSRPKMLTAFGGGTGRVLQAPRLDVAGPYQPSASFWSERPIGSPPSWRTPMSVDVMPAAGPFVAVSTPSYERNSTTTLPGFTSARPSCGPF